MEASNEIVWAFGIAAGFLAIMAWRQHIKVLAAERERTIRRYIFSGALFDKLRQKHPHLEHKDCQLVARALRMYFLAHLKSGRQFVGMPSRVVDDLWHELILNTREYARFCQTAFGQYFHHTPATSMAAATDMTTGLRLTWRLACREENIDWKKPTRLPLLFAVDDKLKIANGYHYGLSKTPDAQKRDYSGGGGGGSTHSYHCVTSCAGGGLACDSSAADGGSGGDGGGGCGGGCGGD